MLQSCSSSLPNGSHSKPDGAAGSSSGSSQSIASRQTSQYSSRSACVYGSPMAIVLYGG
jgi:hypothetical protein